MKMTSIEYNESNIQINLALKIYKINFSFEPFQIVVKEHTEKDWNQKVSPF